MVNLPRGKAVVVCLQGMALVQQYKQGLLEAIYTAFWSITVFKFQNGYMVMRYLVIPLAS